MNQLFQQIKSFTRHLGEEVVDLFHPHHGQPEKKVKVDELLTFIYNHPFVIQEQKSMLGLLFNTYRIDFWPFHFQLETKGENNEQILELQIQSYGEVVYHYKSYDDQTHTLQDTIVLPTSVYKELVREEQLLQ